MKKLITSLSLTVFISLTAFSQIIIDNSGNAGIGTVTPSNKLTVNGDADFTSHVGIGTADTSLNRMLTLIGNRGVGADIADTSQGGIGLITEYFHNTTPADGMGILSLANGIDAWGIGGQFIGGYWGARGAVFPTGGANNAYFGLLGIVNGGTGIADSSVNFGVFGFADGADINQSGAGPIGDWAVFANGEGYSTVAWTASDARYKTNINDISDNAIGIIRKLQPKSYEFIQGDVINTSGGKQYGFIAQELEKVIPEAVRNTYMPIMDHSNDQLVPDKAKLAGLKVMNHNAILPFVVKAMQEQQVEIEEQNKENDELQKEIEELRNTVNALVIQINKLDN